MYDLGVSPQELANTAGTFATLQVQDTELLEAVRPAVVCKVWEFNPQDLANSAWAFVMLIWRTLRCWRLCGLRRCG